MAEVTAGELEFQGSALGGAVRVAVDEGGRVASVWVDPRIAARLRPDQLGRGVVSAHAEARAAADAANVAWNMVAPDAEVGAAVDGYAAAIASEHVTADAGLVTAVLRLDGVLRELVVDPRALPGHGPDGLAELITEAIGAAEHEAAGRRGVLAEKVTFRGHPVLEVVREMINDPRAAARRLAADVH